MSIPHAPGAELGGLILAAGASQRMGQPKALLRWEALPEASATAPSDARPGARCLLADQIERLRRAGCGRIVCILGAQADEIEAARAWEWRPDRDAAPAMIRGSEPGQIMIARNPRWPLGAFSSLQCGVRALCADGLAGGRGAILLPVDVPGISQAVFDRLLDAAHASPAPDAVVPVHGGRGGHPVWLAPATLERITHEPPDSRLDHLLRELRVERIEVEDARVALNVNTPEDWLRFLREQAPGA
jgi:molybdenum cofactor cytidylyltransferase